MVIDTVIAAVVLLPSLPTQRGVVDTVVAVVASAALILRRVRPLVSGLIVLAAGLAVVSTVTIPATAMFPVLVSGYSLAAYGPGWAGVAAAVLTVVGAVLIVLIPSLGGATFDPSVTQFVLGSAAVLAVTVWLGGTLRRAGRRNVEHLRERARLLEAEQATQARLARLAERARIAREMHDIVAHSLSVIIVQADGGRVAASKGAFGPGESAASVLGDIADAGRSALADIRALLGLLHDEESDPDDADRPGVPQPGIGAIPTLVEDVGRTGLRVRLTVHGEPRPLPAGTELTVYRAVQEALTNTVKHAGRDASAVVEMTWHTDHLALDVVDDGPSHALVGAPAAGSLGGHGLRGMRERVGAHGGTVEAGPRPDHGFGVHLRIPYAESSAGQPGVRTTAH
jgi:signal transduction histidine kinase